MNNIIQLKKIRKSFFILSQETQVLKDISYNFNCDVSYAISGTSGTGKSTLLQIIAGLVEPCTGQVFFNDQNLIKLNEKQKSDFLNKQIGFVFQCPFLINELTVLENLVLKFFNKPENDENIENAYKLLQMVNLTDKANALPATLSYGQQQRISILRAVINEPKFLIADEPTSNLDAKSKNEIIDLILSLKQQNNMGLIVASHDSDLIKVCQKQVRLIDGSFHE